MLKRGRKLGTKTEYRPEDLARVKFIGRKLKKRRKQLDYSQTEVAKKIGVSFQQVQKFYTITGALFFPFLALALLIWNGRSDWVGSQYKNHPITSVALIGVLVFFSWLGLRTIFGL